MKTVVSTLLQTNGRYRVAIIHRADGAFEGGIVAGWRMKDGSYRMPSTIKESASISEYSSAEKAVREAEIAFSVFKCITA
jgi:hypothetical protein